MRTAVVLFTRDLRVHDHPALAEAVQIAEQVVPLFVQDDAILGSGFASANRVAFLRESLEDLDGELRKRGARLVLREGDVVREALSATAEAGAEAIYMTEDVSRYAQTRESRLARASEDARVELRVRPGTAVIPAGDLGPGEGDHYRVFTPYWRRWHEAPRRGALAAPRRVRLPDGVAPGRLDALDRSGVSPDLPHGGETAGRKRLEAWLRRGVERYGDESSDLAADATSRLSPYLHFGCLSPLEVVERALRRPGSEPFVRQLCWRDFYAQLLAANPETQAHDLRPRNDRWRDDPAGFAAWKEGRTGYPLVDAGMRQLAREGWMHGRARLVTASFLTKDLYVDWRLGAQHFFDLLVDGDVANNIGNWQWVAGTGVDTRPSRVFNPVAQGKRLDPNGGYVRRYVPELAELEGRGIHEPWKVGGGLLPLDYPPPIVDHAEAVRRFRTARG